MFSTQACMKINIYMSYFIYIDDFSCPTNMIIQFSELNVLNIELCMFWNFFLFIIFWRAYVVLNLYNWYLDWL